MPLSVFAAVLVGAALHASWNAIVKAGSDKVLSAVLVAGGSALIALPFLFFLPAPAPESWPFLAASTAVQTLYFILVALAYQATEMSLAYPLMRGSAPVLVALASILILGERIEPAGWLGIALVSGGVLAIAGAGRARASRSGVAFALANACVIATYTLIDGVGVRLSGAWTQNGSRRPCSSSPGRSASGSAEANLLAPGPAASITTGNLPPVLEST